jgi:hypothetical protein
MGRAAVLLGVGLAAAAALIAGQIWGPVHARLERGPIWEQGVGLGDPPGKWPMLGSGAAARRAWVFVDYTCPHCRRTHPYLREALERYGDKVALTLVPVPEETACNHYLDATEPVHVHACAYAKLALAVWLAENSGGVTPTARPFAAFDAFLMRGPTPPAVAAARAYAGELVGAAALDKALADPRIDTMIRDGVAAYVRLGAPQLPVIQAGAVRMIGRPAGPAELFEYLDSALGLGATTRPAGR